jgi:hypothetical protein
VLPVSKWRNSEKDMLMHKKELRHTMNLLHTSKYVDSFKIWMKIETGASLASIVEPGASDPSYCTYSSYGSCYVLLQFKIGMRLF